MIKKTLAVAALALLTGALGWVLWPAAPTFDIATENQVENSGERTKLNSSPESTTELKLKREVLQPAQASTTEQVQNVQDGSLFRLQVVNGATQTPIADATVYEVYNRWEGDEERHFLLYRYHAWHSDIERFDKSQLVQHQANAEGVVVLDSTQQRSTRFFARRGELFGQINVVIKGGKTATLELHQDRSIRVLALDDLGQPLAGIAVGLQQRTPNARQDYFIRYDISNAEGIATLSHLPAIAKESARYFVRPRIPMAEDVAVEIFLDALPAEPITLKLPPLGHLKIIALEADGTPLVHNFDLELLIDHNPVAGRSQAELEDVLEKAAPHQVFRSPGQDGRTSFPFIGLGLNLLVSTQPFYDDWFLTTGHGPTRPGETATLILQRPQPDGFRLRLLNSEDMPLHNREIGTGVRLKKDGNSSSAHGFSETDEQGYLTITFDQEEVDLIDGASFAQLRIRLHTIDPPHRHEAIVKLPTELGPGMHDLGNIILSAQTPLLIGKVVDLNKQPLENAQVLLQQHMVEDGAENWNSVGIDNSNAQGEFFIFGSAPSGPTRFTVAKQGFLPHSSEGTPDSGIVVALDPGSRIHGFVSLPEYCGKVPLQITYRLSESQNTSERSVAHLFNGNRNFRIHGLESIPIDLFLRTRTGRILLAAQSSVLPWKDESHATPDLSPWMPDHELHPFFLKVVDSSGVAIPGLKMLLLDDSFAHASTSFHIPWELTLPMPVTFTKARFSAPGFRTQEFSLHTGKQTLVLQTGLSVRFDSFDPPPLLPGMRIACRTQPEGSRSWQYEHEVLFSNWQELQLVFQEPGRHRIEIELVPAGQEAWLESSEILVDHWFEIDEQNNEQVIMLMDEPK